MSPRLIGLLMIIITLVVPLGVIPSSLLTGNWTEESLSLIIYSVFWAFDTNLSYQPFSIWTYTILFFTLPIMIFNILYIRQIVRYYYGESSRGSAVTCGLVSILLPMLIGLSMSTYYLPTGSYAYIGAIPIQFVAGLILLHKIPGPEPISPWRGIFFDDSWWAQARNRRFEWFDEVFSIWEDGIDSEPQKE